MTSRQTSDLLNRLFRSFDGSIALRLWRIPFGDVWLYGDLVLPSELHGSPPT